MPDTQGLPQHCEGLEPYDLGPCVTALVNVVSKSVREEIEPFDLTPLEFMLLKTCLIVGTTTAKDLVPVLPVDATAISRVVEKLVNQGILRTRRSRTDRRLVHLELTVAGQELATDLVERVKARNAAMLAGVTEAEMDAFVSTTRKVLANSAAN